MLALVVLGLLMVLGFRLVSKPDTFAKLFTPDYSARITTKTGWMLGLLVVGFNVFLYDLTEKYVATWGEVGMSLVMMTVWLLMIEREKRDRLFWIVWGVSGVASLSLPLRANNFVQNVNYWVIASIQTILFAIMVWDRIHWEALWLTKNGMRMSFKFLGLPFFRRKTGVMVSGDGSKIWLSKTIITIITTVVLSLIFLGIFNSADLVFAKVTKELMEQLVPRTLASILVVLLGLWATSLRQKSDSENRFGLAELEFSYVFYPLATVGIITAIFLGVQAKYLFASQEVFKALEITYSEYVLKGFVELLMAAGMGGLLTYGLVLKQRLLASAKQVNALKILGSVFVVEMWLLLASAFKRDLMYIDVYGMTRVRIIGTLFLGWLMLVLLLLLIMNLRKNYLEVKFFVGVGMASLVVWSFLTLVDIDRIIAEAAPEHHEYTDYFYLANLSEEVSDLWAGYISEIDQKSALLMEKPTLSGEEKSELAGYKLALISLNEKAIKLLRKYASVDWQYQHYDWLYDGNYDGIYENGSLESRLKTFDTLEKGEVAVREQIQTERGDWRVGNLVEVKTAKMIESQAELYLNGLSQRVSKIKNYQSSNSIDLYEQENRLLNEFSYPFMNIMLDYHPTQLTIYTSAYLREVNNYPVIVEKMKGNPHQIDASLGDWLAGQTEARRFVLVARRVSNNYDFSLPGWADKNEKVLVVSDQPGDAIWSSKKNYIKLADNLGDNSRLSSILGTDTNEVSLVVVKIKSEAIYEINTPVVVEIEEYKTLCSG